MAPHASRRGEPRTAENRLLRQAGWLVLALAVIGSALFAGSLVFGNDDADVAGGQARPTITPMTSAPPSTGDTSTAPSPTPSPTAGPTKAGMTAFVTSYLTAVTDDPAIAWGKLTPGFQRTSGGFEDYRAFWAPISSAAPSNVKADPKNRTVSYDVRYTYADGHTDSDSTRLTLRYDPASGGGYAITGEG